MSFWKMPPKAKVYEALSALADGRIKILNEKTAEVTSSSRTKIYLVKWNDDVSAMTSNDNGTHWQNYIGYPMIAVLMKLEKIRFPSNISNLLAGVHWKALNEKFDNNFDDAVEFVLVQLEEKGEDRFAVEREVDSIYKQVEKLKLEQLLGS